MLYTRNLNQFGYRRQMTNRYFQNQQLSSREYGRDYGKDYETMPSQTCNSWQYATPETDILELDDQFVLEIALPGVVLDDVELKVEYSTLTVVAKRTPVLFEEKARHPSQRTAVRLPRTRIRIRRRNPSRAH